MGVRWCPDSGRTRRHFAPAGARLPERRGGAIAGRSPAVCRRAPPSDAQWPASSPNNGRRSRSRAGSDTPFRAMLTCTCPQKRSTAVCSCKAAASSSAAGSSSFVASTTFAMRAPALGTAPGKARSWRPCPFDSGRRKSTMAPCRVIGRAIYWKALGGPTSRRWSSVNRVT